MNRAEGAATWCLLLVLTACGGDRTGWERLDLREPLPRTTKPATVESVRTLLGDGVVRRRHNSKETFQVGADVGALRADAGVEMRWQVTVGDAPFLSYKPLSHKPLDCNLTYVVAVDGPDGRRELLRHPARRFTLAAPSAVEVPLTEMARSSFDLILSAVAESKTGGADCDPPPPVLWGSPALYSRRPPPAPPASRERPNVVLVGLDTLRADALGVYGRDPSPSPAIDRLATESDVYLEAFSTFNITNPSFTSIMTGLYGKNHGVYDLLTPVPEEHPTLVEIFRQAGYATAAFLSVEHLGKSSGLARGFDQVETAGFQLSAEYSVGEAMDWVAKQREPFFLWLHLFDSHRPHTPPRPFAQGFVPVSPGLGPVEGWFSLYGDEKRQDRTEPGELYLAEVSYLDRQVGRLVDFLESRGLLETTLVVLVADHGENAEEHGLTYNHRGLWDSTTRVPLLIRRPGTRPLGRRLDGFVQTLDLFPTILTAVGLDVPPQDGQDLALPTSRRRLVFAESNHRYGVMVRDREHLLFIVHDEPKIPDGRYLYDLEQDPRQETNLAGTGLAVEERLAGYLREWLAERRAQVETESPEVSEEELEKLRALGYVDD